MNIPLNETIPVFCTAAIPKDILDEFFTECLSAPEIQDCDGLTVLVSTTDIDTITSPTQAPVDEPTSWPFKGWGVKDVYSFAEDRFDRFGKGIVPTELVILDERTVQDKTCLLVTIKDGSAQREPNERLQVRSDFKSSIVLLTVKITGVGGDGHFEQTGPDGVIRLDPSE